MQNHRFTLGGEEFELGRDDVERALRHVAPSQVRKYYVTVHGRQYPVKQAIAAATGLAADRFISTDAVRVLRNLGLNVERPGGVTNPVRTGSELLFEEYLRSHALGYFDFEPEIAGTSRRPDYRLVVQGEPVLFDVKEFRPDPALFLNTTGGAYDPYGRIREKIEAARKKFKDLKGFSCCLVLYNCGHPLVDLASWHIVYGAMLGNFGFSFPVDINSGTGDPDKTTPVFHGGGKMLRYKDGEAVAAQNTTISAVIVVEHLALGMRRLSANIDRVKRDSDCKISIEQIWQITQDAVGTEHDPSLRQLRVIVYENPVAQKRLSREMFCGGYDERYGPEDGKLVRLYAGKGILELEAEETRSGSRIGSPVLRSLKQEPPGRDISGRVAK
ncbi:MAG: hypothetical protein WBD87_00675 [Candidatus Acidiferrales bacterium]